MQSFQALIDAIDFETANNPLLDINNTGTFPTENDISALEWTKQKNLGEFSLHIIRSITTAMVGREPSEVGIHYLLDYIKSGGGFISLSSDDSRGSQQLFIREGKLYALHVLLSSTMCVSLLEANNLGRNVSYCPRLSRGIKARISNCQLSSG